MSDRHEWVKCIQDPARRFGVSLCGLDHSRTFMLVDLAHAEALVTAGSRLIACEKCVMAARAADAYDDTARAALNRRPDGS